MVDLLFTTFLLYILILIAIGVYFFIKQPMRRLSDYMLADRNVGFAPMAISEAASVASGWTFFAWVGIGFALGLHGLWFAFFTAAGAFFVYRVMGSRFRRQSEALESLTIADHLSLFYTNRKISISIRVITTLAIITFYAAYAGAQLIAVGETASLGLDIDYMTAVAIGGIAIAIYTGMGGFNASVWTDFFQGLLMILVAILLPIMMIMELGGWSSFIAQVTAIEPGLLSLSGGLTGMDFVMMFLIWLTFTAFILGQPHSLMRFQAIQSEQIISKASVVAMTFQSIRMTFPLSLGSPDACSMKTSVTPKRSPSLQSRIYSRRFSAESSSPDW